jgi:hypothetical protein
MRQGNAWSHGLQRPLRPPGIEVQTAMVRGQRASAFVCHSSRWAMVRRQAAIRLRWDSSVLPFST